MASPELDWPPGNYRPCNHQQLGWEWMHPQGCGEANPKKIYYIYIYMCVCVSVCVCVYLAGIDDGKKMQKEHAADVACVCVFFFGGVSFL